MKLPKNLAKYRMSPDHPDVKGSHNYALASVMYDVLNRIAIDSTLAPARAYEVDGRKSSFGTCH
jgi:hypothetical protein